MGAIGHRMRAQLQHRATIFDEPASSDQGWISRYAWFNGDYHDFVMKRLRQVEARLRESSADIETRCYVDTGPIVERIYAKYAGLGWIGKNTCLINQQMGSWLFLGVILTSARVDPRSSRGRPLRHVHALS